MIALVLGYSVAAVAVIVTLLVVYARWHYGFLERLQIPVEKPTFLLGSCPDIYKTNPQMEDIALFKKHGPVFGIYEGRKPLIMIADPELAKLIFVRDYEHFHDRSELKLGHEITNEILDFMPEERWKLVRSMLTRGLSFSKLKQVASVAAEISEEFVTDLINECSDDRLEIDFRNRIIAPLLDIAATGLYGLEIENRKDPNNAMLELMKTILCENVQYDWRYSLMMVFPFLKTLFPSWPFPTHGLDTMKKVLMGYAKTRREKNIVGNDLGDVFMDMMEKVNSPEFQKHKIRPATAMAQVVEVFFGSYDSIGTSITMFAYFMALHPEIQEKVLEEVDAVWDKYDGEINYESIGDLVYMTACLNEAMRLYPPFIRPERKCTKAWFGYREGGIMLRIPKGANVVIPIYAMHRNPDYFPDPEKFIPERFMPGYQPKVHNYAFAPFGHGPKNCIGMKLAYNTMKVMCAILMKKFRFEANDKTKLRFKKGTLYVTQFSPMYIDLVRR